MRSNAGAGVRGTFKGRSSACERRDNGPTLTYQTNFSPVPWDRQSRQFPSKNSNQCVPPEVPPGTQHCAFMATPFATPSSTTRDQSHPRKRGRIATRACMQCPGDRGRSAERSFTVNNEGKPLASLPLRLAVGRRFGTTATAGARPCPPAPTDTRGRAHNRASRAATRRRPIPSQHARPHKERAVHARSSQHPTTPTVTHSHSHGCCGRRRTHGMSPMAEDRSPTRWRRTGRVSSNRRRTSGSNLLALGRLAVVWPGFPGWIPLLREWGRGGLGRGGGVRAPQSVEKEQALW